MTGHCADLEASRQHFQRSVVRTVSSRPTWIGECIALAQASHTGGEEPQAPTADWAPEVAYKVRKYLSVL